MSRLVLADDDEDLRTLYAAALRRCGHEVLEAVDGATALAAIRTGRPDLVLLDIWMPGLNGFEVLDALRHDPAGGRLRVIMLSNLSDADARLEAFEGGAVAYLVKGLSLAELTAAIEGQLAQDQPATAIPE